MLPTHPLPGFEEALAQLASPRLAGSSSTVRIGLADGRVLEGSVVGASPEHLAVSVPGLPVVQRLSAADIRSLEVAVPRQGREWALAGVGIVAGTAGMVGVVSLPVVGTYLRLHAQVGFKIVFLVGAGLLTLLLAKTRLRAWLTGWRTLYRIEEA